MGGRKIIGTFRKGEEGIRGRGTLARPTFFEAINAEDRQTERAGIDEKKKRERGEKKRSEKRARRGTQIYAWPVRVHPGRLKTRARVRAHCCATFSAKRGQLKGDRNSQNLEILRLCCMIKKKIDRIHGFIVPRKPSESILSINVSRLFSFTAYFFYLSEKCLPP